MFLCLFFIADLKQVTYMCYQTQNINSNLICVQKEVQLQLEFSFPIQDLEDLHELETALETNFTYRDEFVNRFSKTPYDEMSKKKCTSSKIVYHYYYFYLIFHKKLIPKLSWAGFRTTYKKPIRYPFKSFKAIIAAFQDIMRAVDNKHTPKKTLLFLSRIIFRRGR